MKKKELVHLHMLLAQLKMYCEEKGMDCDFTKYKEMSISPFQIHRSMKEHEQAIFVLSLALLAAINQKNEAALKEASLWKDEKADFNSLLQEIMNTTLESEKGNGKLTLCVEDVDMGIFIYPDDVLVDSSYYDLGDLVYPVYTEDLTVDASLLAELIVREDTGGLLSKMLMRIYINEKREVEIKNRAIYETEISERDLKTLEQRKAVEEMLEDKTNVLAEVMKGALERIMKEKKPLDNLGLPAINQA